MALTTGTRLGDYEISAPIGAGGMGEVYQARDTKLGRDVAIKILPEAFATDRERLARFEREARLLASLNHPGIATLHGFESHDGVRFLVMELVEGETLEERIQRGAIEWDEALPLFAQIAEAMEAAHNKGIIHRDLKPANIKITSDGRPKILDFGLAKGDARSPDANISESPTVTRGTSAGVILGTAPYMSPEQARGKPLDKRADVWAFGCVFYEALTGRRAFDGSSVADVLASIVRAEPNWSAIPNRVTRRARELLERCLTKDLRYRLRDLGEAWVALARASEGPVDLVDHRPKSFVLVGLVAVLATVVALVSVLRPPPSPTRPLTITEISLPNGTELARGPRGAAVAIATDGRHVAYLAKRVETHELYLRALDRADATLVDKGTGARNPFFSPDGQWLGFYSPRSRQLMKVSVSGGAAVPLHTITRAAAFGASWAPDGSIVFNPGGNAQGLSRITEDGEAVEILASPNRERLETVFRYPDVLPDGGAALFTLARADLESFDDAPIAVLSLETHEYEVVLEGGQSPRYSTSGHLVYARAGSLLAAPFDASAREVTGTPAPVLNGLSMFSLSGAADYALSREGTLLYAPGDVWGEQRHLVWVDRQGASEPIFETPHSNYLLRVSPDGNRVAAASGDANMSLWVYDLERSAISRIVSGWQNSRPAWSPDGRYLTFQSNRRGLYNLYQVAADGTGSVEAVNPSEHPRVLPSWSPDGKALVFVENAGNEDIWWIPMEGDRTPQPFLQTEFRERYPAFSPNGRWIAYHSNESGRPEVYVLPFPPSSDKWQVSTGGGGGPVWGRDGKEIFYDAGGAIMAVDLTETDDGLVLGQPEELFESSATGWDVAPDGERFIMTDFGDPPPAPTKLYLVMNWDEELKRLVPTDN